MALFGTRTEDKAAAIADDAGVAGAGAQARRATTRPAPKVRGVPSILASDLTLAGRVASGGEVHLEGRLDGELVADRILVGESAKVAGDLRADWIRVLGVVEGRIIGREVTLGPTARVTGDLWHEVLVVEAGAMVEGALHRGAPTQAQMPAPDQGADSTIPKLVVSAGAG